MRFPFRALPAASGGELTPRPVVDIALEGLPAAPMECLLDTGALLTRMSAELARLAGIELGDARTEEFFVTTSGDFQHPPATLQTLLTSEGFVGSNPTAPTFRIPVGVSRRKSRSRTNRRYILPVWGKKCAVRGCREREPRVLAPRATPGTA